MSPTQYIELEDGRAEMLRAPVAGSKHEEPAPLSQCWWMPSDGYVKSISTT